jgi:two-component system LytT family response regulator
MINAIIVEDEVGAALNLQLLLSEIAPEVNVLAVLPSIGTAAAWLSNNQHPALGFFDIQLEDGLSFEIFKRTDLNFPVIFTTAFNHYAIEAFKVNSVDYLLKPIKEEDLRFSLNKYKSLQSPTINTNIIHHVLNTIAKYRDATTFLIHYKEKLVPVPEKDFAFFCIEHGLVHGYTHNHQTYPIDHTVEDLQSKLTETQFFKANRQYIVNRSAIKEIEFYFNSRLSLKLFPAAKEPILVSKARVPLFKAWLKG